MTKLEEGIEVSMQFAKPASKSKTISTWHKRKIPAKLRREWYEETVVRGIADYNALCEQWLKENVK